jgi:hypothetical protein
MAKQDKLNRMPPYLPIIVEDWQSDPDTQSMTDAQVGIFFKALLYQWQNGSLPRNAWDFAKKIDSSYDTTFRFLSNYSRLFVCCECFASWSGEDCECGASNSRARCENRKLKNLRIDVNTDVALGTTEPKLTKTEPKLTEVPPPDDGIPPELPPQEQEAEVPDPDSSVPDEAIRLAQDFWCWLSKPARFKNPKTFKLWSGLIESKTKTSSLAHVRDVLHYAATESDSFAPAIKALGTKRDPMEYCIAEKWENILSAREFDLDKAKRRNKKQGKEKNLAQIEEKLKPMEIL